MMRTRTMPVLAVGVMLSCLAIFNQALGQAGQPQPEMAGVVQTLEAAATVESVDPQARQVLLHLPDDTLVTLRVGPQVRNVAQLKPGDRVAARYTEAVAVRLARSDGSTAGPSMQPGETATGAPMGQPTPVTGGQIEQRANVREIDRARNTVSFAGPDNATRTVTARDPGMVELVRTLNVGDPIDVVYVEGVAIGLEPVQR
jgi:hypothetical protein